MGGGGGRVGGGGGGGVGGVVGLGVRVDVNGEVKFCENSKKNKKFRGGGWVGVGGGGGFDQGVEWGRLGVARFGVGRCWVWGM